LTRASDAPPGWRCGRITQWLAEEVPDLSGSWVLCAGSPGFVDACVATARALGAAPERIVTDSFTPTVG
jgi:CDP-4-dehydro-6-deoxyglucose reductase, E3